MKFFLIISIILIPGFYGFGQIKTFIVYTYGGDPSNIISNTETIVGQKWDIEYVGTGNCLISKELKDSIDNLNEKTCKLISKKHGTNWKEKYNLEFDNTIVKVRDIHHFLKQQELVKNIKSNWTDFMFTSIKENGNYLIKIFGFGDWNGSDAIVIFYNIEVDLDQRKVIVLNDEIELLENR